MSESKTHKPKTQIYYFSEDYEQVLKELPDVIDAAKRLASEVLEPTIHEKREVMKIIREFIREKERKVYGGTALNEALKMINPEDAIYDETIFSDIEFYSPTPAVDLVELTNILYHKGYKYIQGKEAQHDETYSIFVNMQLYCDITYVPRNVYYGIRVLKIDGINYVHPHFMLIDYLRMINDPMNAAEQRWEKAFKRIFKLLKNYPLEHIRRPLNLPRPSEEVETYLTKIRSSFLTMEDVRDTCLITGFSAYNFFVTHAMKRLGSTETGGSSKISEYIGSMLAIVPYFEFVSVSYVDTVVKLYNFIRGIVEDPKELSLEEYFPLFQFTNYSVVINYKNQPIAKVYEADGQCITNIKIKYHGYRYVSYQYLLMSLLIFKFQAYLRGDELMYCNYRSAISNLVEVKNIYRKRLELPVINDSIFGEFKISCVGTTISYTRMALLRKLERKKKGKRTQFVYEPEKFFALSEEEQKKFDPSKHLFRNTSGNMIRNPKNLKFRLDESGNIQKNVKEEESYEERENNGNEVSPN
ncbi:MAG: hypothetical protein QXW79_00655 [Thermoplasmata archaeon]